MTGAQFPCQENVGMKER